MTYDEIQSEINALHQLLDGSDFYAAQMIESLVATMQSATAMNFISKFISWMTAAVRDYGDKIRQREEWRVKLRELEALAQEAQVI